MPTSYIDSRCPHRSDLRNQVRAGPGLKTLKALYTCTKLKFMDKTCLILKNFAILYTQALTMHS